MCVERANPLRTAQANSACRCIHPPDRFDLFLVSALFAEDPSDATGRKAKWTVIIIGRFERDKLAEDWAEYDRYNLFRQLGAL